MDLLVNWVCSGNTACTSGGQENFAGTVQGLKATDIPVQVACAAGKSINVKAYPYQQGAMVADATIEFDKTVTCNPQGRALFTVTSTNDICYTLPPSGPGCSGKTECRLKIKATEDGLNEDVEEVITQTVESCAV